MNAESVEKLLREMAWSGSDITYAEALRALGIRFTRPKMRELCRVLATVDNVARQRGEPELAVLVVRADDRLPGEGWWASRHRYYGETTGEQAQRYVTRLQRRAFRYWKEHVPSADA